MIEIKHRWNGSVLYTAENAQDVRTALREALDAGANLRGANLLGANLLGANLRGANLLGANLRGANLRDANLLGANLLGANLLGANLRGANLRDADLRDANLRDANLRDADLRDANLRDANLRDADLLGANLLDADLRGANLLGANLRDANLRDANLLDADLRGADLWNHPLWSTRQDIFSILDQAPAEVAALREAMVEGRINGSVYNDGDGCGCLCGTIGILHPGGLDDLGIVTDGSRPAERWFIDIVKGDKPLPIEEGTEFDSESAFRLSWALVWLDAWIESRTAIAKALGTDPGAGA